MIEMKDGDTFSFLPDQCWYRVKIIFDETAAVSNIAADLLNPSKRSYPESTSESSKRKKMDEDNTSPNSSYVSPSRKCTSPNNLQIPVKTETTDDAPLSPDLCEALNDEFIADIFQPIANITNNELPLSSPNKNLEEGSPQSPPRKLNASDESLRNTEVKEELSASDEIPDLLSEPRWDMDETADIRDVEEEARVEEETIAKTEEDKKGEEEALEGSSKDPASNQNAGASCTNTNPSTTRRERCWYGGNCYR